MAKPEASPTPPEVARQGEPWTTRVLAHHPLVGRIVRTADGRFVPRAELERAIARARFVLLGEKHDNVDHHRLQAELLDSLLATGRRPALVLEMLDASAQRAIDAWTEAGAGAADGFAEAVGWDKRGWEWAHYRPLVERALDHRLPIVAANISKGEARAIVVGEGDSPVLRGLSLPPLAPAEQSALARELEDSHCGELPAEMIPGMMLVQRARDAMMAQGLRQAGGASGAVLIAGAGHVRRDRGAPLALAAPAAEVLALAVVEVQAGSSEPADYVERSSSGSPVFDFVWLTPRLDDKDPCAELRDKVRQHGG